MDRRRGLVIAMLALGAALLVYAALARGWWVSRDPDARAEFGLRDLHTCVADRCQTTSYADLEPAPPDREQTLQFLWTGRVTMVADLVAAAGALVMIVMVVRRRRPAIERGFARGAAGVGLVVGILFVYVAPAPIAKLSHGLAFYAHWIVIALAVIAELAAPDLDA